MNILLLINKYRRSDFVRNVFHLVSGTAIAQLIPILLQPVLRRIYAPADFGAFSIYFNVMSIIAVAITLRYEQGIVIARDDDEATNVLSLSGCMAFIFSFILAIILFLFFNNIKSIISFPQTHILWLYFLPLSVFLFSFYEVMNYWLIRKKAFKSSAINKISRRSVEGMVQTFLGFKHNSFGLFIGDILGNLSNVLSAVFQMQKSRFSFKPVSWNSMIKSFRRFSEFPKYNLIPTLLNAFSLSLPLLIINKLYDSSQVGYIDLSRQVLAIPMALISTTLGQVLLQRLAVKKNNNLSIFNDLKTLFTILTIGAVIEIIIIVLFGEYLFGFVFGKAWSISGYYSKILVVSYSVKFIMTTLSITFIALEKVKIVAVWQVLYFGAILLLFFFKHMPVNKFLVSYALIEVLCYVVYFILLVRIIKKYENELNNTNLLH